MPVDGEDECVGAEAHAAREREANEMQRVRGGGGDAGGEMKEAKGGGGKRWRREERMHVKAPRLCKGVRGYARAPPGES